MATWEAATGSSALIEANDPSSRIPSSAIVAILILISFSFARIDSNDRGLKICFQARLLQEQYCGRGPGKSQRKLNVFSMKSQRASPSPPSRTAAPAGPDAPAEAAEP